MPETPEVLGPLLVLEELLQEYPFAIFGVGFIIKKITAKEIVMTIVRIRLFICT